MKATDCSSRSAAVRLAPSQAIGKAKAGLIIDEAGAPAGLLRVGRYSDVTAQADGVQTLHLY